MALALATGIVTGRGYEQIENEAALAMFMDETGRPRDGIAMICHPLDAPAQTTAMAERVADSFAEAGVTVFCVVEEPYPELGIPGVTCIHFQGC
jgi:hypothetical protein